MWTLDQWFCCLFPYEQFQFAVFTEGFILSGFLGVPKDIYEVSTAMLGIPFGTRYESFFPNYHIKLESVDFGGDIGIVEAYVASDVFIWATWALAWLTLPACGDPPCPQSRRPSPE